MLSIIFWVLVLGVIFGAPVLIWKTVRNEDKSNADSHLS
jgi:uncharacterized Tic20 family protein